MYPYISARKKIMPWNFQDMILGVYAVSQEPHWWPIVCTPVCTPFFKSIIFQSKMKIMPWNFQDMILVVYMVHQESHGWPIVHTSVCTPVCTHEFSNAYISAKNQDNARKLSGYDGWGLQGTSRPSWMTHCAYPCLYLDLYPCLYPCLYPWIFKCLYFSQKWR